MKLPPYYKFPEIDSDTFVLRQVEIEDIKDIVEISYYNSQPALTVGDAIAMQDEINKDYENGSSIHWGIADKKTNVIMGTIGYYRGFDNGIGELGCVLKPEFSGKGIMTAAVKLAAEFGINTIGLTKVIAITTKQNSRAVKLFERLNFIRQVDLPEDEIEFQYIKGD
ncbi:GNAT family N-acetyltransferase [Arenibacter palladensis]|uniref:GNAT family N-acetyltransferase n=1 Tax=Arenibacter palladensis TaxID=237373 RepID=UPI0026E16B95|nr:GNAT family N-acetyltransferase [Arenibacter palladensis]MDO6602580.1 GNAT family N-acetyltransferase [Arenibacter palladensis]